MAGCLLLLSNAMFGGPRTHSPLRNYQKRHFEESHAWNKQTSYVRDRAFFLPVCGPPLPPAQYQLPSGARAYLATCGGEGFFANLGMAWCYQQATQQCTALGYEQYRKLEQEASSTPGFAVGTADIAVAKGSTSLTQFFYYCANPNNTSLPASSPPQPDNADPSGAPTPASAKPAKPAKKH